MALYAFDGTWNKIQQKAWRLFSMNERMSALNEEDA